ncbi:hypothetical protein C1646_689544 [Rhizophagus diaphanus]|nr:hypothetical protein C1646_689544 [Rhizophagus diaphanus] [Rhizophagus sp. MUCL 43196]
MKFNTLLLLLTTLTAVALSQRLGQTIIHLLDQDLYWGLNDTDVVLYPGGVRPAIWTRIPFHDGTSINIDGKSVQYNGDSKPLTIEEPNGSLAQRWIFEDGPEGSFLICSREDINECATAFEEPSGWPKWAVKAENRTYSHLQLWKMYGIPL